MDVVRCFYCRREIPVEASRETIDSRFAGETVCVDAVGCERAQVARKNPFAR